MTVKPAFIFVPPPQNRSLEAADRRGGILLGRMKIPAFRLGSFIIISILAALAVCPALCAEAGPRIVEDSKVLMGTTVRIQIPVSADQEEAVARAAIDKALKEVARIEGVFSVYKDDSDVSRINRSKPVEAIPISDEVFGLIEKSIDCSKKTNGAFDITVKPLVDLWRAAGAKKRLPSDGEIAAALKKVGSQYILLDKAKGTITFQKEGMALDFGGIAKGYATDRAVAVLKECGVKNALVSSGGDMYCLGMKTTKEMWKVGIQHPRDARKVFAALRLKDKAIDTSGDYEKYFILHGKRYSHIIDPRTGYPIGDNVVSATVVADDAASADMFATALCVLGNDAVNAADALGIDALVIAKNKDKLKVGMAGGFKEQYGKAKTR